MRILGIDPGLTRCGIGVIDVDAARITTLVHVEVARTKQSLAVQFRLSHIGDAIDLAISKFKPEVVAIERVFAQDNLQSVTTTMQVMGVAMLSAGRAGLPLAIHTPSEVKAAVTGSGTAPKSQVQNMVARVLGLEKVPKPADAADALAVAICHGWRGNGLQGASADGSINVSLSGGVSARGGMTQAQKQWASAIATTRRKGAVDPRVRGRV